MEYNNLNSPGFYIDFLSDYSPITIWQVWAIHQLKKEPLYVFNKLKPPPVATKPALTHYKKFLMGPLKRPRECGLRRVSVHFSVLEMSQTGIGLIIVAKRLNGFGLIKWKRAEANGVSIVSFRGCSTDHREPAVASISQVGNQVRPQSTTPITADCTLGGYRHTPFFYQPDCLPSQSKVPFSQNYTATLSRNNQQPRTPRQILIYGKRQKGEWKTGGELSKATEAQSIGSGEEHVLHKVPFMSYCGVVWKVPRRV